MSKRYAIGVQHEHGIRGYFLDDDRQIKTYPSEEEARKALRKMLKNPGYSWNCDVRVFEIRDEKRRIAND